MNGMNISVAKYQSMSFSYKETTNVESKNNQVSTQKETEIKHSKSSRDELTISMLYEESEKAYDGLRRIVDDLLKRQGITLDKLGKGNYADKIKEDKLKGRMVKIDAQAKKEAAYMIGPNGPLNAENTSDRIVKFAKAISGGDKNKLDELKDAIKQGFDAVKEIFGELPELSQNTYDLVMEKLDKWENGEEETPVPAAV